MRRSFLLLALLWIPFTALKAEPTINFVEWTAGGAGAILTVETDNTVECVAFYGDKRAGAGIGYPTAGVATVVISIPAGLAATDIRFQCSDR